MRIFGLIAGAVACWCLGSGAAAAACDDPQTQAEITICATGSAKDADAALNAAYRQVMARLANDDRERLRSAQRAWITFRDKECAFRSGPYDGGSIQGTVLASCISALTNERVSHLLAQAFCAEGDISCVAGGAGRR